MEARINSQTSQRSHDITTKAIGPQLFKLTMPMLYALVAIMGLGVVDSYFISFLGTNELAAIGFIVPITQLITSFGLGLGMAISSLVSKQIGAKQLNQAARIVTNGFYLTALLSVISVLVLATQLEPIFTLIGANKITLEPIADYMYIWVLAAPAVMFTMVCSSTFRALGDTRTSANIAIVMTLSNVVLTPIFIFGMGPIPEMGIQGAALATLLAVLLSFFIGTYQLYARERLILISIPKWQEFSSSIKGLLEIAIPAVLANSVVPITAAALTTIVAFLGNDVVAGYGVGTRIEAIMLIVIYALSSTLPMFIGQNLGAGRKDRVKQAITLTFRFTITLQLGLYILLALLAEPIAAQFSEEASVQKTIVYYLRIVPLTYGLSGIIILINVSMNVLGKPQIALYINIIRLLLFYIPLAYVGSHLYGLTGFYIGIAFAHCLAFFYARFCLKKVMQELDI